MRESTDGSDVKTTEKAADTDPAKSKEQLRKENCELMDQVADLKKRLQETTDEAAKAQEETQKLRAEVKELKDEEGAHSGRRRGRGGRGNKEKDEENPDTPVGKDGRMRKSRDQGIQDLLDSPPKKPTEGPEEKAKRAVEEKQMQARDQLRGASSADELRSAIAAAKDAGLKDEVKLGEKKLAKLE